MRRMMRLALRAGAQGVPVAGVATAAWAPVGGLILYWVESVLLLAATALFVLFAVLKLLFEIGSVLARVRSAEPAK